MSRWIAAEALPARSRPDAALAPEGRIAQDTILVEIERRGVWVRVENPQGRQSWVDGRRLQALPEVVPPSPSQPDPPAPAPSQPHPPPAPPTSQPHPPAPPSGVSPPLAPPPPDPAAAAPAEPTAVPPAAPKRRLLLVALVIVAAALIVAGFVFLRGGGSATPTALRGYIPLDFRPTQIGMDIPRMDGFYLTDGESLTGVDLGSQQVGLTTVDTSGAIRVEAMSGVGFGFLAKTADSGVLQLASYAAEVDSEVALPSTDCCADVLVGTDNGFIAFPEVSGRSDSYLEYNGIEGPAWTETPLPAPITVTSAALVEGFLFVGHTQGLLALSPWDGCSEPVTLWDQPTAALAVTHPDMTGPTIAALDTQNRSIAVVDPGMTRFVPMRECDSVIAPRLRRVLSIGNLASAYQPSIALIDTTAYVVDTGGTLHIVDVGSAEADLVRDIALPNLPAEGASLIAVPDWLEGEWNVFVADPAGSRLWWIGTSGRDAPDNVIVSVSES